MSNQQTSGLFTTCSSVCWTLAIIAGMFVASICEVWLGLHGLVGAVIGMVAALILGNLLKSVACTSDGLVPVTARAAAPAPAAPKPTAKVSPQPMMYKAAPADADDLKVISGVGPGLEKTLNEMGVYKFEQIASWGAADIEWVDDRLKFKGRITRDNWVEQAKELAKG